MEIDKFYLGLGKSDFSSRRGIVVPEKFRKIYELRNESPFKEGTFVARMSPYDEKALWLFDPAIVELDPNIFTHLEISKRNSIDLRNYSDELGLRDFVVFSGCLDKIILRSKDEYFKLLEKYHKFQSSR